MSEEPQSPTVIKPTTGIQLGVVFALFGGLLAAVGYAYQVQSQVARFGVTLELKLENQNDRIAGIAEDVRKIKDDVGQRVTDRQVNMMIGDAVSGIERREDRFDLRITQLETNLGKIQGILDRMIVASSAGGGE